ncbi:MAG: hypothetical protein COW11_06190 [Candidatus Omnitrophica bacterium CG12_big_fil_rev_8_21_14_0_65_43_15]|uniref:ABC transporter domain-containing protein n=1 Tax=Candidatus Taenaricola geysiri TaxID=1974752 RepID=A0A2J0LMG4_9BACT|nr:MAG: hypothetical protein COW11_06190 [Candidatus Omnitrophica bacterium CG12_big_fil_rev_8_21_14_0_65_43_15]
MRHDSAHSSTSFGIACRRYHRHIRRHILFRAFDKGKKMVDVKNIYCGYDKKEVIKGVSFSVEKGNFTGIIGPNGAGKTTLFRAMTGALPLYKGTITYRNNDISKISARELAKDMAVIPQIVSVPFSFTVSEFVFMARFAHLGRFQAPGKVDYDAVDQALRSAGVAHLKNRDINELSGGERQMAILAQGFAQSPKILLLDEPTAHLDIKHQVAIMNILEKLNKERGLTVVVILHDLNLAAEYCNNLILLNEGKIHKKGGVNEVLTQDVIEEVYKTFVAVDRNPVSGKPYCRIVKGNPRVIRGAAQQR